MHATIDCTARSNLAQLPDLQSDILQALILSDHVEISTAGVETADLGFVQLLESARLHATQNGKSLRLAAPVGAPLRDLLDAAGLLGLATPDTVAFWCHEEDAR